MKVFQILHKYNPYIPHFEQKYDVEGMTYEEHRKTLIKDRFYALHLLKPVLDLESDSFYTMWDYEKLQLKWAKEKGWKETDLKKIVFAQMEEHKPDVFYNASPLLFTKEELTKKIAPSVIKICWSASPFYDEAFFKLYQTRLTNLPLDVLPKADCGFRNDLFTPVLDPVMNSYGENKERPIDLFFYGQYADDSFKQRNTYVDRLLAFKEEEKELNIKLRLQYRPRKKPVVNIPYIRRFWQKTVFPSKKVIESGDKPTYGLDLYEDLSKSKIVFNAGVDFSKEYKVNMRNFEVLGCGAHMISDVGTYPEGFEMDKHFSTYRNIEECLQKIKMLLKDDEKRLSIAQEGKALVQKKYTKEMQWNLFEKIVASL